MKGIVDNLTEKQIKDWQKISERVEQYYNAIGKRSAHAYDLNQTKSLSRFSNFCEIRKETYMPLITFQFNNRFYR